MSITIKTAGVLRVIGARASSSPLIVNGAIKLQENSPVVEVALQATSNSFILGTHLQKLVTDCPDLRKIDFTACWVDGHQLGVYVDVLKNHPNKIEALAFRHNLWLRAEDFARLQELSGLKELEWPTYLKVDSHIRKLLSGVEIIENPAMASEGS